MRRVLTMKKVATTIPLARSNSFDGGATQMLYRAQENAMRRRKRSSSGGSSFCLDPVAFSKYDTTVGCANLTEPWTQHGEVCDEKIINKRQDILLHSENGVPCSASELEPSSQHGVAAGSISPPDPLAFSSYDTSDGCSNLTGPSFQRDEVFDHKIINQTREILLHGENGIPSRLSELELSQTLSASQPCRPFLDDKDITCSLEPSNNLVREPLSPVSLNQKMNSFLSVLSKNSSRGSEILNTVTFESSDDYDSESGILTNHIEQYEDEVSILDAIANITPKDNDIESCEKRSSGSFVRPHGRKDHLALSRNEFFACIYYISSFGILGTILRVYVERLFGYDCDVKHSSAAANDWFERISSNICVTATGTTNQTGGALFTALPCNILGSFIMGLLNPENPDRTPTIPWFRPDHPLQAHHELHIGLKVGLCGCLTTFASWNTQMVVMLDGSDTELGSQIAPALFGYILGVSCSIPSFYFGQIVAEWLQSIHAVQSNSLVRDELDASQNHSSKLDPRLVNNETRERLYLFEKISQIWYLPFGVRFGPLFWSVACLAAFVMGDVYFDMTFYRGMWMAIVLSPVGSLARWRLSRFNLTGFQWNESTVEWFPLGTFLANIIGSVVAIVAKATSGNLAHRQSDSVHAWIMPLLAAVADGFSGSLSTVSTLVKEMTCMLIPLRRLFYCWFTIFCSMILSLCLYRPILLAS